MFCDVCLQRNRIHALADLQYWGYLVAFLSSRPKCTDTIKGGFPVVAEITHILAANISRQFFFVITTTGSTRCLVQNFQLITFALYKRANVLNSVVF